MYGLMIINTRVIRIVKVYQFLEVKLIWNLAFIVGIVSS